MSVGVPQKSLYLSHKQTFTENFYQCVNKITISCITTSVRESENKKRIKEENREVPVKLDCIVSHDRCTCSIQGEKEHKVPSCRNIFAAEGIASQG